MVWERLAYAKITGSAGILTTGDFTARKICMLCYM